MFNLFGFILSNQFSRKYIYIFLKKPFKHRYIWAYKKPVFYKPKKIIFKKYFKFNFKKKKIVNKIIKIKRLTGLFKKKLNFRSTILKKRSFLFTQFNKNNKFNKKKKKRFFFFKKQKIKKHFNKYFYRVNNIVFYNNRRFMYFENRKIIRFFLKNKFLKKQNKLTTYLVNFLTKNSKSLINYYEYKLNVILIKTHIFNNLNDSNFFIKKGLISVNNKVIFNSDLNIKINHNIKIINKNWYYKFYRDNLNGSISSLKKLNWAFYRFKKKNRFRKKKIFPKVYNWISINIYFGFDIPYYFEVDYINLTIFLFIKPINNINTDYFNIKYLNYYLTRLYNWNYII